MTPVGAVTKAVGAAVEPFVLTDVRALSLRAETQLVDHMNGVAQEASTLGLSTADVLGAHAWLGVHKLDGIAPSKIHAAAEAARELRRSTVAIISNGPPPRHGSVSRLGAELRARGADPMMLEADRIEHRQAADGVAELWYRGLNGAESVRLTMPDAVYSRGVRTSVMMPFERAGVHMANLASTRRITLSKIIQAGLYHEAGVPHPQTIRGFTTLDDVRRAADQVGFPAVVKISNGSGGSGVRIPVNREELEELITIGKFKGADPKGMLVQQYLEVGAMDMRVTVTRNPRTGMNEVTSAYTREATGDTKLAHGDEFPSKYTYIPLGEVDAETKRAAIGAADATGLDQSGIDVVTSADGRKWVLEANGTPGVPETDVKMPYFRHSMRAVADWLVYGSKRVNHV